MVVDNIRCGKIRKSEAREQRKQIEHTGTAVVQQFSNQTDDLLVFST